MLGMIDTFKFEVTKTEFDAIAHEISWNWAESKRIGNHVKLQSVGKSTEIFTFTGTLILQSIKSFDELVTIADKQEPVVLSFANSGSIMVVIESIKKDLNIFLKTGEYIKQGFSISLKRWYP